MQLYPRWNTGRCIHNVLQRMALFSRAWVGYVNWLFRQMPNPRNCTKINYGGYTYRHTFSEFLSTCSDWQVTATRYPVFLPWWLPGCIRGWRRSSFRREWEFPPSTCQPFIPGTFRARWRCYNQEWRPSLPEVGGCIDCWYSVPMLHDVNNEKL